MTDVFGFDAFSPKEIAERVEQIGVAKARLPLRSLVMLGMLAGAFIGLGALFSVLVTSDPDLGFAVKRVLAGVTFSLGLLLVVVAGAELFTGNNLLAMAWADGRITTGELLRNWILVCLANFAGALVLAALVFLSGHAAMNGGLIAEQYLAIAITKTTAPLHELFFRGVLCNVLVCLAVWMALAGRTVTDRFVAIVLPISAFVAAGFEHSIANMFLIPLALMLQSAGVEPPGGADPITMFGLFRNLLPVIAGNVLGGSVLVALVYFVIYRLPARSDPV